MCRLEPAHLEVALRRGEAEELGDVAVVGGDGVRGRVAIETEILEEGTQLLLHCPFADLTRSAGRACTHSSSAASARAAVAALRSTFFSRAPLTGGSGGGMMPKVMLVGW